MAPEDKPATDWPIEDEIAEDDDFLANIGSNPRRVRPADNAAIIARSRRPLLASHIGSFTAAGFVVGLTDDATYNSTTGVMGGTDAAQTIQDACDQHMFNLVGDQVRVPLGSYRLTGGLHFPWGSGGRYRVGRLSGAGRGYNSDTGNNGTTLYCDFVNQPAISIQYGRNIVVENLSLVGKLRKFIEANNFGSSSYAGTIDDTVAANWIDPTFSVDEIAQILSVNAPYACIAIDPKSGTVPSIKYPDDTPPSLGGETAALQYGRPQSSDVKLETLEIIGFAVAIIGNPNSNHGADANSDFVTYKHIDIFDCIYGIVVTPTQARMGALTDVYMSRGHTAITNRHFGLGSGRYGDAFNFHVAAFIQVFDFGDTSILGALDLPYYAEDVWREGNIINSSSTAQQVSIRGNANFGLQNLKRGVPATMVTGGTIGQIKFDGGYRGLFYGFYGINHPANAVIIDGTEFIPNDTELDTGSAISTAVKAARNACAGAPYFPQLGSTVPMERKFIKFQPWNLDTGSAAAVAIIGDKWLSNRTICTPLWVNRHCASGRPDDWGVVIPRLSRITSTDATTGLGLTGLVTGRTMNATLPGGWVASLRAVIFGQKGDILLHSTSMTLWVFESISGSDYVLNQQTGWNQDGPIAPIDFTNATVYVASSRWYSPALPVYGVFTNGSAVITEVGINEVGTQASASIDTNLAVADYIIRDDALAPYISASINISALDNTAKTITMGSAAIASSPSVRKEITPVCGNAAVGATAGWVITGSNKFSATLPAGQTNSTLVIPITGLRVGDTVTDVAVVGQIESGGNTVTATADVRKLTAAAADLTDASLGTDTLGAGVTADTLLDDATGALKVTGLSETMAAGEQLYVLLTGTTAAATDIDIQAIVATVTNAAGKRIRIGTLARALS